MTEPGPTTPTNPPPHGGRGVPPRGLPATPSSSTRTGRFGRMFRRLPVYELKTDSLVELGCRMVQRLEDGRLDKPLGVEDEDENTAELEGTLRLPAAYTYFGQFVDHDITFDPVSSLTRQNDPDALTDFRTPRFDLDSLYGNGPSDEPYLYEPGGLRLALGDPRSQNASVAGPDLQRGAGGRALIGDPRNDENLIVSQLHVAFALFHNRVVDLLVPDNPGLGEADLFKLAQQTVRWHYQWVVIHDFLRRLVGEEVVSNILRPNAYQAPGAGEQAITRARLLFYRWREAPFMPVEFSVAAYRFGHSMARPSYLINDVIPLPVVDNADRIPLFSQGGGDLTHLNGFRPLPEEWGVQWKYLLPEIDDVAGPNDARLPQPSYRIDTQLANPLGALPNEVAQAEVLAPGLDARVAQSLAARNLLRGRALGLPSGPDVARAMGLPELDDAALFERIQLSDGTRRDLAGRVPLWFYVLREAELLDGAQLGPVGGRIVAEVLIGLLDGDPLSFLSVDPTWRPFLSARVEGEFTLSDLINVARPPVPPAPGPYE